MEKINTEQRLEELSAQYQKKLGEKFQGKDGKKHLVVCGGTGCLSSHSGEILEELERLIK